MTYPTGEIIEIGDLIWIDEGAQQGLVAEVVEDSDSLASRGVEGIGIFVALTRPSGSTPTQDLFIMQRFFKNEGIGPVAAHEPRLL